MQRSKRCSLQQPKTFSRLAQVIMGVCSLACTLILPISGYTQVVIDVVGGAQEQRPIVISPFMNEDSALPITSIIRADLQRTGGFQSSTGEPPFPGDSTLIRFPEWRARGAEHLLTGGIYPRGNEQIEIRVRLFDIRKGQEIDRQSYILRSSQTRKAAHKIADWVYEHLTGKVGVFNTKVAYVMHHGHRYELQVADTDAFNPQTPFASKEPILSPRWSPDGRSLAYVSFELNKPAVFVQSLATGERRAVAAFKGSNSAPAWFPDGRSLAVVLTRDGMSQLYRVYLDGSPLQRIMHSSSIDTEPDVSPDGRSILFVSDRGGTPQIYKLDLASESISRQTFEGSYNVSPHFSPDSRSFVYIRREGGRFGVAIQDMATHQIQNITHGPADESPGFSPNGEFVLYTSRQGRKEVLMAASLNGSKYTLHDVKGDLRESAWSPIGKR
jgi:TolB protein